MLEIKHKCIAKNKNKCFQLKFSSFFVKKNQKNVRFLKKIDQLQRDFSKVSRFAEILLQILKDIVTYVRYDL